MIVNELTQLDELRTALRAIDTQLNSVGVVLNLLRTKVDNAYHAACREFNEDGGMNKEAAARLLNEIPYSMKVSVPDAAYAWKCGDEFAQTRRTR